MKKVVIIRLNAQTRVFENTEDLGSITDFRLVENLLLRNASEEQIKDFNEFSNDKYSERITIETTENDKLWFFYIIK